jgi:uncharacterized phage protein (TIGR01671 family)
MREILFRGKRIDNGEWVEGDYQYFFTYYTNKYCYISSWSNYLHEVKPETVGQYTGLLDKNGKRIFEGDILQRGDFLCDVTWCNEESRFIVAWYMDGVKYENAVCEPILRMHEVVGNIHDNPELVEVE